MVALTGTARDDHTSQLAEALNEAEAHIVEDEVIELPLPEVAIIEDVDVDICHPPIAMEKVITEDVEKRNGSCSASTNLIDDIIQLKQPVVQIETIDMHSKLIVSDNIEVKKEELEDSKRITFTPVEDEYIRAGCKKYSTSKSKWADILKDPDYKFRPCRTRDTLRVRATSLKNNKRRTRVKSFFCYVMTRCGSFIICFHFR
jgi:hypothetical protein